MRVLISGAGGFIGSALRGYLPGLGHQVFALERGTDVSAERTWSIAERRIDDDALDGIDAVIHLSGRPIRPPFTATRKREIMDSRRVGTRVIAEAVADHRPEVFVCASAIGIYGDRGQEILSEGVGPGDGFLADVVGAWEAACEPARDAGVRTVNLRSALVLDRSGGLLPMMALPFRLWVGGRLGSGEQWWSWISLEDEVRAIAHCLENDGLGGPVNLSAPEPVRNQEFVDELGAVLRRPVWLPVPSFLLKLVLGTEAAEQLVLASQRVVPARLEKAGFVFQHPTLRQGLSSALSGRASSGRTSSISSRQQ